MSASQRLYCAIVVMFLCGTAASSGGIVLRDDLKRTVTLPAPAERIVSLAPSITETLFAIGAGEQVAGVTDYCNYPPQAAAKPHVGGVINPSIETVIGLKPDLIILSMEGNVREDFGKLTSFGVPVFVTNPRSLEGIHRSITQLGSLTGREDAARELVSSLQTREQTIAAAARQKPGKKTLMFVSLQPLIVVGGNTFLNELLEMAGASNPASTLPSTYPTYSREAVVAQDPDVIILTSDIVQDTGTLTHLYPEWAGLRAFKTHNVFRVESDIVSRPGPRAIDGLEALYSLLHSHEGTE